MKYIVPLFRQNTGRVSLGLVNWDSFQTGFRVILRENRFAGVTWDPWWREHKPNDRRKGQRRAVPDRRSHDQTGHRLCSEKEIWQPLRLLLNRRSSGERRTGRDRRKRASHEKLIGLLPFIRELGRRPLSDADVRLLVRICAALTTRDTFESWKRTSSMTPFFKEPDWDEKENHEKFREFAVASFLDLLRPGSISWKGPSQSKDDLQCVSRIIGIFARASERAKLQSIRAFVESESSLERMRKVLGGESFSDKREV